MEQPSLTYHEELIVDLAAKAFKEMKEAEQRYNDARWAYSYIEKSMREIPAMMYWLERRNRHWDSQAVYD